MIKYEHERFFWGRQTMVYTSGTNLLPGRCDNLISITTLKSRNRFRESIATAWRASGELV